MIVISPPTLFSVHAIKEGTNTYAHFFIPHNSKTLSIGAQWNNRTELNGKSGIVETQS